MDKTGVDDEQALQIGDRVASTWRHVTAQGWAKTGRMPWGYRLRPATAAERAVGSPKRVLEIDPESAPFVAEAFQKVAAGESARRVGRWVARLPDGARGGRRMTWSSVERVLRRSIYAARPVNGADEVLERSVARWPALVADDVWQTVQDRLNGHQRIAHQASGRFLLTGVLRCPVCGGPMRGDGEQGRRRRYRCGFSEPTRLCSQTADSERIERLVLDQLCAVVDGIASDPRVQAGLRRAWQVQFAPDDLDTVGSKVKRLEAEIQRARQRIKRATELLVDGTIERDAYDDLVTTARADAESADRELATIDHASKRGRPRLPPLDDVVKAAGSWTTILQGGDVEAQREVLAPLVERVVAVRERPGVYRAELAWTSLGQALRMADTQVGDMLGPSAAM